MRDWRSDPQSAGAAVARTHGLLRASGLPDAGRDSRLLVAAALGCSQTALLGSPEARLSRSQQARLAELVARRLAREPVSRIRGERGFFGREFEVTAAALDPRPESETVIAAALELIAAEGWQCSPLRILDIGTGSGCLLVTLLAELPRATGVGTDIDPAALAAAQGNARRHRVHGRARLLLEGALERVADEPFDLLVSNPPYIPTAEIAGLEPEVSRYEPRAALDGGPDGLHMYRQIAANLIGLVPNGWAVLEVGAGQADRVCELLTAVPGGSRGGEVRRFRDLDGRERCVAWKARHTRPPIKPLGIPEGAR